MRIIVSLPGLSSGFLRCPETDFFTESSPFEPSKRNLDTFRDELQGIPTDALFCINIPGWDLGEMGATGVSGPGKGELWHPSSLKEAVSKGIGTYDKWRPYPATPPLSTYSIKMAKRFSNKRFKILTNVVDGMRWKTILYVEHGPTSIVHLSETEAFSVGRNIIRDLAKLSSSMPYVDMTVFSPYGIGTRKGFVLTNRIKANRLDNWTKIRTYLKGIKNEDIGD